MKSNRVCFLGTALLLSVAARAQFVNGSFEDPDLTGGAFTSGLINGWSGANTGGVWNTQTWNAFNDPIPDGDQIGYLNAGGTTAQVSSTLLVEGDNTVSFWLGKRKDGFTGDTLVDVWAGGTANGGQIVGGTAIGFMTVNAADLTAGAFQQFSITKTLAANDPLIGQALGFRIAILSGVQIDFDNIQTSTVPEPVSMVALASGLIVALRKRRTR